MEWFSENWVWVLFIGGMVAMHMFGHGGHGGRGGHGGDSGGGPNDPQPASKDSKQRPSDQGSGHQH